MFKKHNNATTPCPVDPGGHNFASLQIHGFLSFFLKLRKRAIITAFGNTSSLPSALAKIQQYYRVNAQRTVQDRSLPSYQLGIFECYKLTGEV